MVRKGVLPRIVGLAVILMALILAIDLAIPLGVAGGVPYVAVVLLGIWLPHQRHVIALAVVTSVLTIAGYFFSSPGGIAWMVVWNRALALFAIWVCALLVVQRKREEAMLEGGDDALRRSQSRLAEAQRLGQIGHFRLVLDPAKLEWSDQIYRIFGLDREETELTPDSVRSLMHPDDLDQYLQALQATLETKRPFSAESRFVRPDGRSLVLGFEVQPELDKAGDVVAVFGTAQDITQRKQVEEALRESERRLSEAQQIGKIGHFRTNLATGVPIWSEQVFRLFGYAPGEIEPSAEFVLSKIHPDDVERYLGLRETVIEQGRSLSTEFRVVRRDGKEIVLAWTGNPEFDEKGEVVSLFGTVQDITERKRTEEELSRHRENLEELVEEQTAKLRQSEERFKDFAESASDWFWEMGPDLAFTYGGDQFYEITGWHRDEVYGRDRGFLIHPELEDLASDKWRDHFAKLDQREPFAHFEYAARSKTGTPIYLSLNGTPVFDDDGAFRGYRGTGRDITKRRMAGEALRGSEAKFRNLVEGSIQGVCIQRDWRILFVNKALADILGYQRPEDVLALGTLDALLPPTDRGGLRAYSDARIKGQPAPDRYRMEALRQDGSTVWIEVIVNVVQWDGEAAIQATVVDVTTEVEAVTDATTAREQLLSSLDAFPEAVALYDKNDRLVFENAVYREQFVQQFDRDPHGRSFEEILREYANRGSIPEAEGRLEEWVAERLEQHRTKQSPLRVRRVRDREIWLEQHDVATPDGGSLIMYFDVTELQQQEDRLRQAQKMEAIGQLTGGVAHDFNNLLAVIMGNADLLGQLLDEGDTRKIRAVKFILRASRRGAELTQRLLAFSRRQLLDPKLIDLGDLLPGIIEMLGRTLGETIEIRLVQAVDLGTCEADPGQLENALLNLAINARDAMPGGGQLTIETDNVELDDGAAAQYELEPGPYVTLAVSDSGSGIEADQLEHVFEPFFTTKEVGQGSGLGLSMVYGFARQSGGCATIYSEVDQGTTVRLYLPRSSATQMSEAAGPNVTERGPHDETVLVVEDDDDMRYLTVDLLETLGYAVQAAGDGQAALEILKGNRSIDLLLTDVILPGGILGPELAERAGQLLPSIKVLYMSGYAENAIQHQGRLDEDVILLPKPFDISSLSQKLRLVLD
ncbi:MAG: PAS domain S-box protein [Alphaproteobacteria bacterium]|jgi:PAS domain S-box-containing protein|nr:PAS domain S-box protein [Alphaproteobacteria bacterium]